MATPDFDVVIVGAGAGGGVAAYVLSVLGGKRVALLEKGRNPYPTLADPVLRGSLFGNDEMKGRRYFAFQDPMVEPRVFWDAAKGGYVKGEVQGLGVCVGGGTVQYDANSPRLQRADLTAKSSFGAIEGADVEDWPLPYDELVPYYDEVERLIGVQGQQGADPFAEPRRAYPMPAGYPSKADRVFVEAAKSLGYHPHPMPTAVNSIYYRGRPACVNCGFCPLGCPINAKGSTAVTVIRDALLGGNLTLMDQCCATRIEAPGSGGKATGVRYLDPSGIERSVTASHVVVAANAIETPRLLLESGGLGNGSGLLGKYLMYHKDFSLIALFDQEIRSYRGRCITKALADFTVKPAGAGPDWMRGGYVELGGQIHPVAFGTEADQPIFSHKAIMIPGIQRRKMSAICMIAEDMPVATNRVELDPTVKDVYGRRVPRITYKAHPRDLAMADHYAEKLREIALKAGANTVMPPTPLTPDQKYFDIESKHLLGTARMGTDSAKSVCDPWGRLHECDNVWICDGSTWPTSAAFNPVLTQQALAFRTAARILKPGDETSVLPAGPA